MATQFNKNPLRSPIFLASTEAIGKRIKSLYSLFPQKNNRNIDVTPIAGPEALRAYFANKGAAISFPFFAYMYTGMRPNPSSYNKQVLRHMGITSGLKSNGQAFRTYHLTPVIASFRIFFITDNQQDVFEFSDLWISNEKMMSFTLDQDDTNFSVGIKVLTDEEINIPEAVFEEGELFSIETGLQMETYTGYINDTMGIIKKTGSVYVTDQDSIDSYKAAGMSLKPFGDEDALSGAFKVRPLYPSNPEL